MRLPVAPLWLFAWLPFAVGQTGTSSSQPTAATTAFRDDSLRLSYAYPSTYTNATTIAAIAFQAALSGNATVAQDARCIALPFSRIAPGAEPFAIILLVHAHAACLKKEFNAGSVLDLARGEAQGIAASGAKTSFGEPVPFTVAARPAAMVTGSFALPTGQTMQARIVCVLDQPDIACWQFLSFSAERLAFLGAFPVMFDGSPATPLVPATLGPQAPRQ